MEFVRGLNRRNFIFQATVLKIGDFLVVWNLATNTKFQLNILKIRPVRHKNTWKTIKFSWSSWDVMIKYIWSVYRHTT